MEKQLPKNWTNTELKNLISHVIGGDWGKEIDFIDDDYIEVLCIRGSEIKNWTRDKGSSASLRKIKKSSLESRKLELGDILLEISGGGPEQPVGRTVIIDHEALAFEPTISKVCTNFLRLLRLENKINSTFINHYLHFFYNSGEITKYQGGSNNLRNLKFKEYETIKIPLPPLPEQNRIVAKLDSLFAQLETIKSSMATVPLLLKDFRQQVLTQAVTGKLTNCKVEEKRLGDLLTDVKYGTSMKSEYDIDGTPVFRIPNINDGEINDADLKYSKLEEKEYNQLKLVEGDVLIIRSNGSVSLVGRGAIIRKKHIGYSYAGYLIRLRCGQDLNSEFLNYTLKSDFLRTQIVNASHSSSGVNNINSQEIKDLKIYWTNPNEQQEIVNRLKILFAKADAIEKQYESLKTKIDNMPQAILHKAFKGELTEQLDSDGDARELLKEIQALKATGGKVGKKVGKTVKHYNEKEVVLEKVAEPDNTNTFTEIMNQLNFDYEIAAIVSLTFGRFQRSYGKKYIHKMFSNIELLNTLPVFTELTFEENGWGMFSPQIKKAIEEQKFIQFEEINDNQQVLQLNFKYFKEVSAWMKEGENKEFISQVNEMLTIYENPIINKKMDNIELFNTVLECMKVLKTDNFQAIYEKMKNWPMKEEGFETKADKFKELETQSMIDFIKEIKN